MPSAGGASSTKIESAARNYREDVESRGMQKLSWLIESRRFLAENFAEPLTLSEAAGVAAYSPYHYHRLFTSTFGETPLEYVTRLRFEEARRLLCRSSLTVAEICAEVGYGSPASFSLAFAGRYGRPPTEFRRVFSIPGVWAWRIVPTCFLVPYPDRKNR